MSFTSEIKKELISRKVAGNSARASLSAFVRTCGALAIVNGEPNFFLVSETEYVAEYFTALFFETFDTELAVTGVSRDRKRGKDKLVLQCQPACTRTVLERLCLLSKDGTKLREGISATLIKKDEDKLAYIAGAFLGGGSCTLPKGNNGGYHLEIVFEEKKTARDFCKLLDTFAFIANAKLTERKETFVVYIKSKEAISDFLAVLGLENALNKFNAVLTVRDEANRDNRAKNCMAGNADKSAIASVKQVVAIEKLRERTSFADLSEELCAVAKTRLQYPTMSMRELAQTLSISKSCLNHRIRKILEIAENIEEE